VTNLDFDVQPGVCPHAAPEGKCPLGDTCQSPGIPTRTWDDGSLDHTTAVLCLGEAPGYEEDRTGRSWVGIAGQFLHRIIRAAHLSDFADIYLANAARCHPPGNGAPSPAQVRMCHDNLEADLRLLQECYEKVYVLCLGRWAAYSAGHKALKNSFSFQGLNVEWFPGVSLPTFYTYHPAALFPGKSYGSPRKSKGRDPSRMRAVTDHLQLFWEVLSGKRVPAGDIPTPDRACPPPAVMPREVVLDIETYGILRGFTQTVFHPRQAELVDGIPRGQQVVLVSLAWEEPRGERTAIFVWEDARDRDVLYRWLSAISSVGGTILGKNIPFDIKFLRYNDVTCRHFLSVAGPIRLDDLDLVNTLDYELRPEKSLKPLSELLGVAQYSALQVRADIPDHKAKSPYDPNLWKYGATDGVATLRGKNLLMERIAARYGSSSPKLSRACADLRNAKLWSIVYMGENGMPLDWTRLNQAHDQFTRRMVHVARLAEERFGLLLTEGVKGNVKSQREAVYRALLDPENPEVSRIDSTRVQLTEKTKDIGIKDENVNLALKSLSRPGAAVGRPDLRHNPWRAPIVLLRAYRRAAYKVQHFTRKLRENPRKGVCEVRRVGPKRIGMVYPSWWAAPSSHKGSDEEGGGTIQGRMTCTGPALQTFPGWAKALYTSALPGGVLLSGDEQTLELRIAYLFSGDPFLGDIFARGGDPHTEVAQMLFPGVSVDHPMWRSVYRQVGKKCNFLVIYGGEAEKFYDSLQQEIGHLVDVAAEFPIGRVEAIIEDLRSRVYRVHFAWRREQVVIAGRQGYLEVPSGTSRTFSGGPTVVASTYANECSNFPVQTTAAELVISAQHVIQRTLSQRRMRSRICLNTYDSVTIDCPPTEVGEVRGIIHEPLTRPPLLAIIEEAVGRSVELRYDLEVKE